MNNNIKDININDTRVFVNKMYDKFNKEDNIMVYNLYCKFRKLFANACKF